MSELQAEVLRMIDVNVNRSREALRLVEDYARFVRDDGDAAAAAKRCRHGLQALVLLVGHDALLDARDIVGDVGRDVKTPSELQRADVEAVVRAAFGRLTEATRVLGEYGKLINSHVASAAEGLRYEAYALEQRVVLRGALRQRFRAVRLYVLITADLCRDDWVTTAEAAIRGGAGCVQLREKALDDAELLRRARQLREMTARYGALLAINDRPDIARLSGADIVHVGQDDLRVADVRHIAGGAILVGKSTHTVEQFEAAQRESPDYLAVGPMYASETKAQAHVAGVALLRAVRGQTALPIVAIGGITRDRASEVYAAGADCVAVCGAVSAADDPERAARGLVS